MSFSLIKNDWIAWESTNQKGRKKSQKKDISEIYHSFLFKTLITLTFCGLLLIASSSSYLALSKYDSVLYYLLKQGRAVLLALAIGFLVIRISVNFWMKIGPLLLLITTLSLVTVFVLNHGEINGSYRWIQIGSLNIQPSEFVKIAVLIYLAGYLVRYSDSIKKKLMVFIRPMLLIGIIGVLMILEPDLGGTLIVFTIAMAMMFVGGVNIVRFILFGFGLVALAVIFSVSASYRWARIIALNDNIMQSVNTYDDNYQILQSLVAFGQGHLTGLGFGASLQKMLYLPEAHNDFIFAILAEELGLIGIFGLSALLIVLIWQILKIAKQAVYCRQAFSAFYAYGYAILIAIQSFVHIAVTIRLLPTTGMTLPFISYGGSSFLAFAIGAMILLRIEYELCPQPKPIVKKEVDK